jgi:hypothetical protein
MLQVGEQPRFALELAAELVANDEHLLQSHAAPKPLVGRFVDRTHAALPDLPLNAIALL